MHANTSRNTKAFPLRFRSKEMSQSARKTRSILSRNKVDWAVYVSYGHQLGNIHHHIWGCQTLKCHVIIRNMDTSIGMQLGKKIKEYRRKRGITQEQLAELIETSYKYIQRIEGKNPPDIRLTTIERLSKALKIKPAELLKF